jgi:hypothetical protein
MTEDLNFAPEVFQKLPVGERIERCRKLAERRRGTNAAEIYRIDYLRIAPWLMLADEME